MKTKIKYLTVLLAAAFAAAGCNIKEDRDNCGVGAANIRVYVESFGGALTPSRAVADNSEARFNTRIETLTYYLYRSGQLIESGQIDDAAATTLPYYVFSRSRLPYGDYTLGLTANCGEDCYLGTPDNIDEFMIRYLDDDRNKDYFIDLYSFRVIANGTTDFTTQLKRMHGVVRYEFRNIPQDVKFVRVTMDGLASLGGIRGTYSNDYTYSKLIDIKASHARAEDGRTIVGTFPTMEGASTNWTVTLYGDGQIELLPAALARSGLRVVRNRLLDLMLDYENGMPVLKTSLDPDWDGSEDGGTGIID